MTTNRMACSASLFVGSTLIKDNRITVRADIPIKPIQAVVAVIRRKLEEAMKKQMEEMEVPELPDEEF